MHIDDLRLRPVPATVEELHRLIDLAYAIGWNDHLEMTFHARGFDEWMSEKKALAGAKDGAQSHNCRADNQQR